MHTETKRIQFLDFLRGFAVIFMVMGHSIDSVLSRELRSTQGFILYDAVRGFTAPIFLFVSGFAYIIATERRWDDLRRFSAPTAKRALKVLLLFVIGYALHFPFFSFGKLVTEATAEHLAQFFQADILHCVGASLLLLQLALFITPTRRAFAMTVLALTAFIVLASPIVWRIDFAPILSPALSPYMNQMQVSIFPLFPFAAFLFTGVAAGHFFLEARETNREREFIRRWGVLAIVSLAAGILFDLVPVSLYPPHDYWKTSPNWFLVRIGIVMILALGVHSVRRLPATLEKNLVLLGQASLLIYPVHLIIVYGSAANGGLMQLVGQTLAAHQAVGVGVLVLVSMVGLTYAWNYIRTHHFIPARLIQVGIASTLLYSFFTRPW